MSEDVALGYGDSGADFGAEEPQFEGSTDQDATEAGTWGAEQGTETSDEPVYEIDGKSYTASELRELIKSGMLERDYRIKTAQLAEERRQIEQLRQAAEAWNTLQQLAQQYPELAQTIQQKVMDIVMRATGQVPSGMVGQEQQFAGEGAVDPITQELTLLRQQLAALQADYYNRVQQYNQYLWQQYYAQREAYAKAELPKLREKYPMLRDDEVIEAFKMFPEANLEELAKASHEEYSKFFNERMKADVQKRMQNAKARVAGPAAKAGAPAASKSAQPTTLEEANRLAMERLAQLGSLFGGR